MDSQEYKQIQSRWNVKRRNVIVDTMVLIKSDSAGLYRKLEATLAGAPIEKPNGHKGSEETDYFEVQLTEEEMQDLVVLLFDLEAASVPQGNGLGFEEEAMQAREGSRIGGIVDEWNKLNAE